MKLVFRTKARWRVHLRPGLASEVANLAQTAKSVAGLAVFKLLIIAWRIDVELRVRVLAVDRGQ